MSDPKRIGSIGGRAIALYLGTTALAIVIGLICGTVLQPGAGADFTGATPYEVNKAVSLTERFMAIVPENPFEAFSDGNLLAIIFFAIMTGCALLITGEKARGLTLIFEEGSEMMLKMTSIVMEFAPFGVFALVAWVMGSVGLSAFMNLFILAVAVYIGCFVHMFLVQGPLVKLFARLPVRPFFKGAREPQLVAFSTSSSSATLPATLSAAEHNLGIKPAIASSVLPLGATVNMDGAALYVTIVTLFAAQAFGMQLELADYLIIGITTTLVSVGASTVPSGSLFLMAVVLESIGMTPAQSALVVGFVLPFDRILDMMRTVVNITGDLAVSTIVAKWEGEIDESIYKAEPFE